MAGPRLEKTRYSLITRGVEKREQTLKTIQPFWVFLTTNIGVGVWLLGVLIANMGLSFADGILAIFFGSLIGAIIPSLIGALGPASGLPQMELARYSLGQGGKKIPAFLNWAGSMGWDCLNNILSGAAFVALLAGFGIHFPFWLALAILVALQLLIGIYGHHLIQDTAKYTGLLLGIIFVAVGIIALQKTNGATVVVNHPASMRDVLTAFVLMVAYNTGSWATYMTDYTRYLPAHTPKQAVFLSCFMGLWVSVVVMCIFGFLTASLISEQTPDGVMHMLQNVTGHFSPLILLLVSVNSIPTNAVNDNSAAYSLMSAGFKLSRPVAAASGALFSYILSLLASDSFMAFFENFLYLFFHWVAPWSAIILIHWWLKGKPKITPKGFTFGFALFAVISALSVFLFSSNSLYTGILSDKTGGVDIGPFIGFAVTGIIYYATLKSGKVKA